MKPLPEDPPVYQRPPERWFEVHEHETVSGKPSEKNVFARSHTSGDVDDVLGLHGFAS